ncbi:hypothetical protein [Marinifaba aquimaris]|uniref:hypothetical protein n=1 Tax=Marinifaba aquimaris TaxID=2741323 RepID=UPI001FE76F3C|nr:hypothetical protein [Marinifaba aquimaris]
MKDWPLIGEKAHQAWLVASEDTEAFFSKYSEQISDVLKKVLSGIAGFGGTIIQFIISFIIAGVFIANAKSCERGVRAFFCRLIDNERGNNAVNVSIQTIRSVAQGILGIAITQALLAGLGLAITDIPAPGSGYLWC